MRQINCSLLVSAVSVAMIIVVILLVNGLLTMAIIMINKRYLKIGATAPAKSSQGVNNDDYEKANASKK